MRSQSGNQSFGESAFSKHPSNPQDEFPILPTRLLNVRFAELIAFG